MVSGLVLRWIPSAGDEIPRLAESDEAPWAVVSKCEELIEERIAALDANYDVKGRVAIHRHATVEEGAILKGPVVVCEGAFVAAHSYLRGGVYIGPRSSIGPGCELKSTFLFKDSAVAHLSFVGDSIVGAGVNVEAGVVVANHRNESGDNVSIRFDGSSFETDVAKFGALIGNDVKIGANSVLAPGSLLRPGTIVERLSLVDQMSSPNS